MNIVCSGRITSMAFDNHDVRVTASKSDRIPASKGKSGSAVCSINRAVIWHCHSV